MALYAGQGLIAGLWIAIVVPTLQRQGVTLHDMIGTLAWGGLPWVLKAPAAPVIDRLCSASSGARRRNVLLMLQLGLAGCFAFTDLSDTSRAGLFALSITWFSANVLMSLQDVVTDAASIDMVPRADQGSIRSLMLLSSTLGAGFFGAVGLSALARRFGESSIGPATSLFFVCVGALLLLPGERWNPALAPVSRRLRRQSVALRPMVMTATIWCGFAFALSLGNGMVSGVAGYYLLGTLAFPVERYQSELLPLVSAATLVTYLGLAATLDRLGARRCLLVGGLVTAGVWGGFAALGLSAAEDRILFSLAVTEALGLAAGLGALHTLLMKEAPTALRATFFTLSMASINLGQLVVGPLLADTLAPSLGFRGVFTLAAVIHVTAVSLVVRRKSSIHAP